MKTNVLLSGVVLAGINMILIVPLFACDDPPCDPCWSNHPDCDVYCNGNLNDECCGGECCDHPCCGGSDGDCCEAVLCETCEEENCVSTCDPDQDCCSGECCDESCCGGDCCDEDDCESCVNDECLVCGGDPDLICENGECVNVCDPDGGGACFVAIDPGIINPNNDCGHPIDSYECYQAGSVCEVVQTSHNNNASWPGHTLDTAAGCVNATYRLCYNKLVYICPGWAFVCACDGTHVDPWGLWLGEHAVCP